MLYRGGVLGAQICDEKYTTWQRFALLVTLARGLLMPVCSTILQEGERIVQALRDEGYI